MPKFAANISTMYQEFDVASRFKAAAEDGFRAIEFLNPYAWQTSEVRAWLEENQLELILINTEMGLEGEDTVGLAALPGRESDFRALFSKALSYATDLKAPMIHVLAGVVEHTTQAEAEQTFLENINWAASQAEAFGITLMLEPLNSQDVPGYLYTNTAEALRLIKALGLPNVKLQYDLYHMQIMEGNLGHRLSKLLPHIGHIQFSSVPGRHEPQYGEVNLPHLFSHLDTIGYSGWLGCEYWAKSDTRSGLSWAKAYGLGTQ